MRFVLLLLLVCCSFPAAAQPGSHPYVLPHSSVIPIKSKINGVDYRLYVSLPAGYERAAKRYPVVVTLDANYQFAVASNQISILTRHDEAPEMIVVSIGYDYDADDIVAYRMNRTRDYTPSATSWGGYGPEYQKVAGGASAFANVIEKEILPFVDATYRIDANERVFVGHSFGGLFGAWLLLNKPQLFNRYILASASFWYNDKLIMKAATKPVKMARKVDVYMGVGSRENEAPKAAAMVDDMYEFADQLKAWNDPNLGVEARTFEDETHASVFPAVLSTGIRHMLGAPKK